MKKVLLTTSALTLLAGAAAADLSMSGTGRFGVSSNSTTGITAVNNRFRINFSGSGQTDGGLTFGAYVRVNLNGGTAAQKMFKGDGFGGPRIWISNGSATLTLGNAGGATATNGNIWGCAIGYKGTCPDMVNPNFSWASHSSGKTGGSIIRADFSLGSANVSVSGGNASGGVTNDTEVAATFSVGNAKIGISHDGGAGATGGTQLHVTFDAGSVGVHVGLAQSNGTNGAMVSVSYGIGAGTLVAGGGNGINALATGTNSTYFVSYMMGLGGGASAGVAIYRVGATTKTDAGIKFSF